jgi:hypothetical protein
MYVMVESAKTDLSVTVGRSCNDEHFGRGLSEHRFVVGEKRVSPFLFDASQPGGVSVACTDNLDVSHFASAGRCIS